MTKQSFKNIPLQSLMQDREVVEDLQDHLEILQQVLQEDVPLIGEAEENVSWVDLEHLIKSRDVPPGVFTSTEAIILHTGRPALLIQDGKWEDPRLPVIANRLEMADDFLKSAIPKVGRIELLNDPSMVYVGTGWMIEEDILITNRHVASFFAFQAENQILMRTTPFGEELQVQTDFNEEFNSPNPPFEVPVIEVLHIEKEGRQHPDFALLRLEKIDGLPDPIELSSIRSERNNDVAAIGYPAKDAGRNDPFVMNRIFKNIYNVKRLSPGRITGVSENRFIMTHDCTTLGGNSGSVIINLQDGKAAGLHFAGRYQENNFAVTSETLQEKIFGLSNILLGTNPPVETVHHSPSLEELEARTGYDPDFLTTPVPYPEIPAPLYKEIAPVKNRDDGRLHYLHFSVIIHKQRRLALFTACNINGAQLYSIHRGRDKWKLDPRMDESFQVGNELYKNNPLDRGHLVRRLDPAWGESREEAAQAADDTFFYTNAHPQHSQLNQKTWLSLENYLLDNAATHHLKLSVFSGPVFHICDKEYRSIAIPREYWKVVVLVNEFTGQLSATGYLLSQAVLIEDLEFIYGQYKTYQLPISTLEEKTGLIFGNLPQHDPLGMIESTGAHSINKSTDIIL
jgi:endonuclease G